MQGHELLLSFGVFGVVLWVLAMKRGRFKLELDFGNKNDDDK